MLAFLKSSPPPVRSGSRHQALVLSRSVCRTGLRWFEGVPAGRVTTSTLSIPLTSDLIAAAVEADPRIGQHARGYFAMTALPETLRPAEPLARAAYQNGGDRRTHPAQRVTNR